MTKPEDGVLRERKQWKRETTTRDMRVLTPTERSRVKAALRFMRRRLGGTKALAHAMGMGDSFLEAICGTRGKPSPGIALALSRICGATFDDLIAGRWPSATACPYCGRDDGRADE